MAADPSRLKANGLGQSCRRFNLGDALLLISAIAAVLAFNRALGMHGEFAYSLREWRENIACLLYDTKPNSWPTTYLSKGELFRYTLSEIWSKADLCLYSLLFSITPVVLLIRLRSPRPALRVTVRQAGTAECLAAIVGCWMSWSGRYFLIMLPAAVVCIGATVAIAWIFLKLSRCQAREFGWIDRLGRNIGYCWIYLALAYFLRIAWSHYDPRAVSSSVTWDWSFWWH